MEGLVSCATKENVVIVGEEVLTLDWKM
uniref:Uncharacterized protein n=1 Tax=Nelumbo nucifera TaxID=4432 RepID=A0A822ZBM1_NELNU|nr:TPA_asm: hypothetical protein HUJ06_000537 [Nelumbo nucifera]